MLFLQRESGQGLVEYALVLVLVAVVVIALVLLLATVIGAPLGDPANPGVSPNPANGEVSIVSEKRIRQTTIIDISGRKVSQEGTVILLNQTGINTLIIEFEDGTRAIRKVFNYGN